MTKIKEIGAKTLKENPQVKQVFITSDGYPFLSKNAAQLHANSNPKSKKLSITTFDQKVKDNKTKSTSDTNKFPKNSPQNRGNDITPIKTTSTITDKDYVQTAKYNELMQFVNDNKVALPNGKKEKEVRTAVIAYLENPNKVIVPFNTNE